MMKRYAYFYLQARSAARDGGHWQTLEKAGTYSVLQASLGREIDSGAGGELRLVGAWREGEESEWQYRQLFYIDRDSVSLPAGGGEESAAGAEAEEEAADEAWKEEAYGSRTEDRVASERMAPERTAFAEAMMGSATEEPPAAEEGATKSDLSWLSRQRGGRPAAAAARPKPAFLTDEMPMRRSPLKTILFFLGGLVLTLLLGVSILLYLQHPALLDLADRLGAGGYARMFSAGGGSETGTIRDGERPAGQPKVQPLTTGKVKTVQGVAPTLVGKWSPDDCAKNYYEFSETGYRLTRDGYTSPETVRISETLEDDFQFYLRRSPILLDHLQKLGPNDIQMAGSTGEAGFIPSGTGIQILKRCPVQ